MRSYLLVAVPLLLGLPGLVHADPPDRAVADLSTLAGADDVKLTAAQILRWGGGSFVHVAQTWRGLPVYGGKLVAGYRRDGSLRSARGQRLTAVPASITPVVAGDAAIRIARAVADELLGTGEGWPARVALGVLAQQGQPRLVQVVDVSTVEPVGAWRVFVDAATGEVITWEQRLWTAQADVYPTNPIASEVTEVTLPIAAGSLANSYARVASCSDFDEQTWQCSAVETQATPDANGDFYFDPAPTSLDDPFCEVQMFWHLDLVSRWFEDEFGFRNTRPGVGPVAMEGIVNFSLANAFYGDADGDGIPEVAFGQGGGIDYAYDADVVYHEFGHAVFGSVVDSGGGRFDEYGRLVAASGLNEGSADFFSLAITLDPALGEYAGSGTGGSGAIRDLDADRHCPTDIYGESHRDGEIWAAFGWNLIEDPEIGPTIAAHLIFGALNLWGGEPTFRAAGQAVMESGDALLEDGFINAVQRDLVQGHLEAAGLDDCGRVIRLDEGQRPTQGLFGRLGQSGPRVFPTPNQFSLDAPEGTTRIRFFVDGWNSTSEQLGWTAYVRRGAHVLIESQGGGGGGGGGGFPTIAAAEYDWQIDGSGEDRIIELTASSDPPLEPGATYYVSIFSRVDEGLQGGGFAEVSVTGEARIEAVEPPAGDDDDVSGSGCQSCQSAMAAPRSSGLMAILAMAVGIAARRRR